MKLVVVSEFFYPYKTSTQKIMTELCEDFIKYGLDIEVLTTKNAYREEKQKLKSNDKYNGIDIKRVFSTGFNRDNKIGRIFNYMTFLVSVFLNLLIKNDYDRILFVSNPPLVPYIGYLINKLKKKEYFYLIHDVYPDVAEKLGVISEHGLVSKIMNKINYKIYSRAKKIVVLGKDMQEVIEKKGVDKSKIEIVTNWADSNKNYEIEVDIKFKQKYNLDGKFNIIYTGNISKVHSIDTIIDVIRSLKKNKNIMFTIVGDGNSKQYIKKIKKEENLENMQLKDYIYGEEYNNILNCADLFIVTLQDGIEGLGVPSKTYTYMSVARPIIAIMNKDSEIGYMVNRYNIGKQFNKNEPERIVRYIEKSILDKEYYKFQQENIREIFTNMYERKKVTNKFYDIVID